MQTFVTGINLPASTTGGAPVNMGNGVDPSAPVNGDTWLTTTELRYRVGGNTRIAVPTVRQIITAGGSLTGGGDLSADRTLALSGDSASPGNLRYYGTDGSGTKGFFALPTGSAYDMVSPSVSSATVTGTTTLTTSDMGKWITIGPGSGDYTITLPTAGAGQVGQCIFFSFTGTGSAATRQVTIARGGSQYIARGGDPSGGISTLQTAIVLLFSNTLTLRYIGNDLWEIVNAKLDTPWVDGGAITVTATTTNPTKGTTSIDQLWWRRVGDTCECQIRYRQSTAGTAGAGDYLFGVPFTIDTGTHPTESTIGSVTEMYLLNAYGLPQATGALDVNGTAGSTAVAIIPYSSSQIRIASVNNNNGTTDWWRSNWYAMSNTHIGANFGFAYNPSNW